MAEKFSLKDYLFNPESVGRLGLHFEKVGVFQAAPFVTDVLRDMGALELKARINLIAEVLARHLPSDYLAASDAIVAALPPPLDPTLKDDDFGHFIYAALGVYVENHGLEQHLDRSLDVLEAVTQRSSMEFSIRAFLNRWPDETLERMQDWITHDHYHVRRLVSEGTRPRLPWGQGIGLTLIREILINHGFRFNLESPVPGHTEFWIDFSTGFMEAVGDIVDVVMIGDDLAGQTRGIAPA